MTESRPTSPSAPMKSLPLMNGPVRFEGAVSLEQTPAGVRPWRIPFKDVDLFEPPLVVQAQSPSGVRLTFLSDARDVSLEVETDPANPAPWAWDLLVDGERHDRVWQDSGVPRVSFRPIDAVRGKMRRMEVYLPPQYRPVVIRSLTIGADARAESWTDPRRRWVVYGSSITHAKEAAGPSETWPAIVARERDLHLTNLGYGGQEHLEPMVARMIRDLSADYITLCVGGNVCGSASLSDRTYRAAVIGLVKTIRDGHPETPIAVTSFIYCSTDAKPNVVGLNMEDYRARTEAAVEALRRHGDPNLFYVKGTAIWGPDDLPRAPDGVHPDAEGQHILARRYQELVMSRMVPQ